MAPNPRRIEAKLRVLYEKVPEVACTGACHGACCFVPASIHEKARMEKLTGKRFETVDAKETDPGNQRWGQDNRPLARYRCSMLTNDGRCSVYDDRPMICRLYGAAEGIECHKCGVDACEKPLKLVDGMALVIESIKVGGDPGDIPDAAKHMSDAAVRDRLLGAEDVLRDYVDAYRKSNNVRINDDPR